ncbi:CHC2 zinc finger domain-containing protein [Acidiphilium iwatense]|uniref:CHC2 zinc finger domain-containing protein n=1 Tax=Acidiphilium iwatense TaxID=768198 RepID=A0ABS9DUE3_9PROT|nr:CHC2 zinc finger domain-containing protein [Acidiphilium iwatense]MCF3945763.1 CHC2 zinc finger domain-containing protein [Acidiphilium iwatense]MCF3945770.1 CHC2 zinc finger domain-containing protein [Acidiphilium iwatense]
MARIPASELERLKVEVSLVRLIEEAGIKLARRGKDYTACCPFHAEDTASLVVTPDKNLFHCFGCGVAGGPVDWVMKRNGVSFRHAIELLREGFAPVTESTVKRTPMRALPPPVSFDADDQALLNQVVDYYHETLKQSPEALAYLQARGLVHGELVQKFRLGYANRTLGLRLPEKTRKAGADLRARLERIGIYRESGHEHFNGSLVVPILDEGGNVTELYGRKLRDDLRPGTPKHLYLPGPHKGVWNLDGIAAAGEEIILTESLIDAMAFWCAGFRNVTACYGTSGFTEDHLAAFRGAGILRVLIAFDRDPAGERGAGEVSERLRKEGFCSYRVEFPKGMDAAEYALKVTPAAKSLGVLIRKAVWLGQGQAPAITSAPRDLLLPEPPLSSPETTGPEPISLRPNPVLPLAAKEEDTPELVAALPLAPLPAARVPAPAEDIPAEVSETETVFSFGDRRWRVRGLARNLAHDVLKVNLLASCGAAFHVDALDLYNARARTSFLTQAAIELQVPEDVLKADLGRVLLKLEELQDEAIKKALAPKLAEAVTMDEEARHAALALLKSENLLARILADFDACGIAGEGTNKLVGYLAAVSRKLASPLAVVIQSSSAAGKSALMEAVLAFVPPEERVQYSAMTGQSLFYMGEISLKHRILALAEEEGAARASYALKLLQSEGELTIASTGSDPKTGNLVTQEYRVEGPVMLMMTTTAIDIDEELMNRCLVLAVDEDREQTRAIHRLQRQKRTLAGLVRRHEKQAILDLHRNAQRLLRPLAVVNPYADRLTFLDDRTRTRRDHEKYLTLIDAITLLHQHQRPIRSAVVESKPVEYVETMLADIEIANRLAHEVLGRSLDELPPQTRRMLAVVFAHVQESANAKAIRPNDVRFSRADIRRRAGLADTQCRLHLDRLAALEFLLTHRGSRGQSFEYELLFDGDIAAGAPHLPGLIEVDSLCSAPMTASSRGETPQLAGPSRGHGGANAAPSRVAKSPAKPGAEKGFEESPEPEPESHPLRVNGHAGSYSQTAILPLAASA